MKKRVLLALLVSAMTLTAMPGVTFAGSNADSADNGGLSYEGYTQVWGDEFNGDSLNRDDWNVETHKRDGSTASCRSMWTLRKIFRSRMENC